MRSACVLRQLGRRANLASASSSPWILVTAAPCSGLLRRDIRCRAGNGCALDIYPKPFSTSPTLKTPWKIAPPSPPSLHSRAHPDSTSSAKDFAGLAAPEQFRSVMRLLPNSVVVCTSASGSSNPNAQPRGMTMSSLTSLSLHPTPLITFNIATPSRTLDSVSATRAFNIHVLSGDAEGARVAEWFRRGNAEDRGVFEAGNMREGCGCEVAPDAGTEGGDGELAPMLRGRGVLYGMRCRLLDDEPHRGLVMVRDHVVVLAEVLDIVERQEPQYAVEVFGLAYADRRYRQLGGTMVCED